MDEGLQIEDDVSAEKRALDPVVQAALDRLKAIVDAEKSWLQDPDGRKYSHPNAGQEMDTADLFWVFTDPEARRQFKAHVGIQEMQSFGRS